MAPKDHFNEDIMYGKNMIRFEDNSSFPAEAQLMEAVSEDEDVVSDFNEKIAVKRTSKLRTPLKSAAAKKFAQE